MPPRTILAPSYGGRQVPRQSGGPFPTAGLLPAPARGARAGDEHAVAEDLEIMLPGHPVAKPLQSAAVELDEPVALLAIEVIVAGIAVIVLEDAPSAQGHLAQQAGRHQFPERPVDRGPAELAARDRLGKMGHQLVGVEVIVVAEDLLDDPPPLAGEPFAPRLEKLGKPLQGRQSDLHPSQ